MDPLPTILPDQLSPDQRVIYDILTKVYDETYNNSFVYKLANGAFIGPPQVLLYTPTMGTAILDLQRQMANLQGLPPDAREVAILTTNAMFNNSYIQYAHGVLAKSHGLNESQVESIKGGKKPSDLGDAANIAYDIAASVCITKGPLAIALWQEGMRILGQEGMLALIHYVGFYSYAGVVLNSFNIRAP